MFSKCYNKYLERKIICTNCLFLTIIPIVIYQVKNIHVLYIQIIYEGNLYSKKEDVPRLDIIGLKIRI